MIVKQLGPTDRSLQTDWESELDDAKEYVRKLNVISTNKDKEMDVENEKEEVEVGAHCGIHKRVDVSARE